MRSLWKFFHILVLASVLTVGLAEQCAADPQEGEGVVVEKLYQSHTTVPNWAFGGLGIILRREIPERWFVRVQLEGRQIDYEVSKKTLDTLAIGAKVKITWNSLTKLYQIQILP